MNRKILQILMVVALLVVPSFATAAKKHHHKHRSHHHTETKVLADDGHETDTPTATEDDESDESDATDDEVSGTGSHENSEEDDEDDESDSADDTLKVDEELLAALAAVKAAKEKKKKREKKKKAKKEKRAENDDDDTEIDEEDDASESEEQENAVVKFLKNPETRESAKQTVGCLGRFGIKIFRGIKKEQDKLGDGEKLDAMAVISVLVDAVSSSLESKDLNSKHESDGQLTSRRMARRATHSTLNDEKHKVTLVFIEYDDEGEVSQKHEYIYRMDSDEEEIIAADAIYNAVTKKFEGDRNFDSADSLESPRARRGRNVRRIAGLTPRRIKPAMEIIVHYQAHGKKFRKRCEISTLGGQSHERDVIEVDDNDEVEADDPDFKLSLAPRRDGGRDSRLREIMDADDDDEEEVAAPALPAQTKAVKKKKVKKKKSSSRRSHSRSHSRSRGDSTRD